VSFDYDKYQAITESNILCYVELQASSTQNDGGCLRAKWRVHMTPIDVLARTASLWGRYAQYAVSPLKLIEPLLIRIANVYEKLGF
jgi:hypothetical protein